MAVIQWDVCHKKRRVFEYGKEPERYVGSVLGGFEWPIFVAVDAFAYSKTGS